MRSVYIVFVVNKPHYDNSVVGAYFVNVGAGVITGRVPPVCLPTRTKLVR